MTDATDRDLTAMAGVPQRYPPAPARRAALLRARRHSRRVSRLRWLLPSLCAVLIVSFWGSAIIGTVLRGTGLGFGGIDLASLVDGELVMAEPDISGTINGRRFEVTAERAVQNVARQDEVRFENPSAILNGPQGRIDVTAGAALYGIESETLTLDGGVDVRTVRGPTARLENAAIDLASGSLTSDAPVTLDSPQGRIEALSIQIDDSGARVLFTGRVRARFTPSDGSASEDTADGETSNGTSDETMATPASIEAIIADDPVDDSTDEIGSDSQTCATRTPRPPHLRRETDMTTSSTPQETPPEQASRPIGEGPRSKQPRGLAAWLSPAALALFLAAGVAMPAQPVQAQALTGVQAGEGPIDIEADELEVFDTEQRAVFRGNVRVLRGETTMTATQLTVFYAAKEGATGNAAAGGAGQDIERIDATGPVTVSTPEQTATGANGTYDVTTETVTLTGDVVLTQGENVLRGPKLTVNLVTGQAKLGEGRVRAIFSGGAPQ